MTFDAPGRRFAPGLSARTLELSMGLPMDAADPTAVMSWEEYERIMPGHRREIAFHEAGHAAMHWFFQTPGDFIHIDMRGTAEVWAFVRSFSPSLSPLVIGAVHAVCPAYGRATAARAVMHHLSGPCAQEIHRHGLGDDEHGGFLNPPLFGGSPGWDDWFHRLADDWDCGETGGRDDFDRAAAAAAAIHPSPGRRREFLRRVAGWTEEAFASPRLWGVVTALAARLETADFLDGQDAWEVMEAAWGDAPAADPVLTLGRKWLRRLYPPLAAPAS